jgi:hypothetical protein
VRSLDVVGVAFGAELLLRLFRFFLSFVHLFVYLFWFWAGACAYFDGVRVQAGVRAGVAPWNFFFY